MSGPQKPEGFHALPFHFVIMNAAGSIEPSFIITACALKVAQCFIGLSSCQVGVCRRRLGELMCCLHSACKVVDGCLLRVEFQGLFSSLLRVGQGLLPRARFKVMIGQVFQILFSNGGEEAQSCSRVSARLRCNPCRSRSSNSA